MHTSRCQTVDCIAKTAPLDVPLQEESGAEGSAEEYVRCQHGVFHVYSLSMVCLFDRAQHCWSHCCIMSAGRVGCRGKCRGVRQATMWCCGELCRQPLEPDVKRTAAAPAAEACKLAGLLSWCSIFGSACCGLCHHLVPSLPKVSFTKASYVTGGVSLYVRSVKTMYAVHMLFLSGTRLAFCCKYWYTTDI